MGALFVNADRLKELDFTGEDMQEIQQEAAELYSLSHYDRLISEYEAAGAQDRAEIAKRFFLNGYMEAVSMLTDRYSELIAGALPR